MRQATTAAPSAVAALVGLCVLSLTGCTPGRPEPDAAAAALADGLATFDLSEVPLHEVDPAEATAELLAAVGGLDPLRPAVRVAGVTVDEEGTSAEAVLQHAWDLDPQGEEDWTYSTTARLVLVEGDDESEWQVTWSLDDVAPDLAPEEVLTVERVAADRADVLGAGGAVLVTERPVLRLGLDKANVDPAEVDASARAIATLVGIDPEPYAASAAAAGERAFVEALVVRAQTPGVPMEEFAEIPGALAVEDTRPLAPTRRFARAVLGTAGPATAEIVEESGGQVTAGDTAGLSGLQRQYDEQLRGRPGTKVMATSPAGVRRLLFQLEPLPGQPLQTTIDPFVQDAAESVLELVGPPSAIVALRASTGEVLAVASGPGSEGLSTATVGAFAPGSVFKVASSLALLRTGATPESTVRCPPTIDIEGRTFQNVPGYPEEALGTIPLRTAVAHSCNTAFLAAAEEIPPGALADAAAALGLAGEPQGFPAFLGEVPTEGTGTERAAAMIGQGKVTASPLGMATLAASVAAGRTVVPWLVGTQAPTTPAPAAPVTAEEAAALRVLMRAVVTEGGAQFLLDEPGEVLAKTGTAQFGSGESLANHAWMIAVQGDLAVAVFVEQGELGSTTAGPLLERFLAAAAG